MDIACRHNKNCTPRRLGPKLRGWMKLSHDSWLLQRQRKSRLRKCRSSLWKPSSRSSRKAVPWLQELPTQSRKSNKRSATVLRRPTNRGKKTLRKARPSRSLETSRATRNADTVAGTTPMPLILSELPSVF